MKAQDAACCWKALDHAPRAFALVDLEEIRRRKLEGRGTFGSLKARDRKEPARYRRFRAPNQVVGTVGRFSTHSLPPTYQKRHGKVGTLCPLTKSRSRTLDLDDLTR